LYAQFKVLDQNKYEEIIENLDYTKTQKKLRIKEFDLNEPEEKKESAITEVFAMIFRLLALICIIGLIGFILFQLFKLIETTDKTLELKESLSVEEIQEIDSEDLLQKALDEGDYRTAIRMKFIIILQEFNKNDLIQWKEEKTNRDYLNELRQTNKYAFFREASSIYNLIWYGNHNITKEDYALLAPKLELNQR
jgi:hypothetical protein